MWTTGGSRTVPADVHPRLGPQRSIWVRALRRHDDMSPLDPGDAGNAYHPSAQPYTTGQGPTFVETPWTEGQMEFVRAPEPVRIVYGHHDNGSTTTLRQAVKACSL